MTHSSNRTPKRPLWQRLLFVLALLLIFLGVNWLYTPVSAWRGVLSGQPGDVVYAAGFDGFAEEWQQSAGRDSHLIVDGVLQISKQSPEAKVIYSAAAPTFADFDMSVTVNFVGGSETNEGAGIIFRLQEPPACDKPLKIFCDLSAIGALDVSLSLLFPSQSNSVGYYVFLVSNDGFYSLWHETPAGFSPVTVWHNSHGLIQTGMNVKNRVRVVGRGNQFQFYINGQQVELCVPLAGEQPTGSADACMGEKAPVWEDDSFASGRLGVAVHTYQFPGTIADFDNVIVTMPIDGSEVDSDRT